MAEMTDEQVIEEKLTHGSYNALVGRERLSLTMMEVLRGLLNDDPKERWAVSDLMYWSHGRRQNPKPAAVPRKSQSAFRLRRTRVPDNPRSLERFRKQLGCRRHADQGWLIKRWLRRGFSDEELIESVNEAMTDPLGIERTDDWLVSRVCIALDPNAPLRYRELKATVEGLGC